MAKDNDYIRNMFGSIPTSTKKQGKSSAAKKQGASAQKKSGKGGASSVRTTAENDFFDELEKSGVTMTDEQKSRIADKINSVLSYEPTVGVFGKTGVGKSSLCNALFGQDVCPIDDVAACTRNPKAVLLGLGNKGIKLMDVPGVGENRAKDKEYAELYSKLLPELDLVLWIIKADDRAMTSDESFYKTILKPHIKEGKAFFIVLNQVDKIEPYKEWNAEEHEPGAAQFVNIQRKVDEMAGFFGIAASKIIPVSANERYNLVKLVDEIVFALPREKKITLFRAVSEENKSAIAQEHVQKSFIEVLGSTISGVVDKTVEFVERVGQVIKDILDRLPKWPLF